MTKLRTVAKGYAKGGKYHLVWSFERRVPCSIFYQGVEAALRWGGQPWDWAQPEKSYDYAEWFATSTREEVSACKYMSVFQFDA